MRSFLRKAVASTVSAALVWMAPGLAAHQAWAAAFTEVAVPNGASGPTVPVVSPQQSGGPFTGAGNASGNQLQGRTQSHFGRKSAAVNDVQSSIKEGAPETTLEEAAPAGLEG